MTEYNKCSDKPVLLSSSQNGLDHEVNTEEHQPLIPQKGSGGELILLRKMDKKLSQEENKETPNTSANKSITSYNSCENLNVQSSLDNIDQYGLHGKDCCQCNSSNEEQQETEETANMDSTETNPVRSYNTELSKCIMNEIEKRIIATDIVIRSDQGTDTRFKVDESGNDGRNRTDDCDVGFCNDHNEKSSKSTPCDNEKHFEDIDKIVISKDSVIITLQQKKQPIEIQANEAQSFVCRTQSFVSDSSGRSIQTNGNDFCRICHCESDTELGPLINPCFCSGSLRYVHQTCLQQWIKSSDSKNCELCGYRFVMDSKLKPFRKWEKLSMSKSERRKIICSVLFHVVAITCVAWSLYVLIEKTAEEIRNGNLQWPFWTKLVVVAIGITGGLVFMYVQCKVYVLLWKRLKAFNRVIYVQNHTKEPTVTDHCSTAVNDRPCASDQPAVLNTSEHSCGDSSIVVDIPQQESVT